jgi:DNA-binding GntR family transcriptional regulator
VSIPLNNHANSLQGLVVEFGYRSCSTVDLIANIIREAIVRGVLPQGRSIRQDRVAAELGISKIPLRETLSKLEGQGLVTILPRRGAFVTEMSAAKIDDVYHMRLAIEPQLLAVAIPRMTESDFILAKRLIDQMQESNTEQFGKINWQFHHSIYAPSGRKMSLKVLENLHVHADRYVRLHMSLIDISRASNVEHRRILEACRKRKVAKATQILREHLNGIRIVIAKYFLRVEKLASKSRKCEN